MTFIPYEKKITFEPIKKDSIFSEDSDNIEAGRVLSVGENVTFVKKGDIFFFLAYGAEETPDYEGEKYWTILDDKRFIMGKII